jgi:hypothetical protein
MNNKNDRNGKEKKIRGIENGWFTETATMWPGQKFSLALEVRLAIVDVDNDREISVLLRIDNNQSVDFFFV